MIDHGSGNSTARTGTGLSAHLDDDLLTAISAVAESCDSATGDSDLPDAADVSAANDPAFLIGGEGESESDRTCRAEASRRRMESRAAKPPRRDALHAFGLVNLAARSLEARARRLAALSGRIGSIKDRFEPIRR